ncbi:MAG: DUF559 domain-containing protein, partial [Microbacteriaceae bacterium]|nr:DUF559 domain-containing protein [Microbacteriaceae bacterium]
QRRLVSLATSKSDSLLETIVAHRLRTEGLAFVQQAVLLGHRVDFLVDGRVVLQIDGWEHHGDEIQRRRDIELDAKLLAVGHPTLRRDFYGVVRRWPEFARDIRAALIVAQRLGA